MSSTRPPTCFDLRSGQSLTAALRFGPKSPIETPIALSAQDTLTVSLTAKDSGKAKRPHQAFLLLKDDSGLEAPFPLSVKDSGKAKVQIVRSIYPGRDETVVLPKLTSLVCTDAERYSRPVPRVPEARPCDRCNWVIRLSARCHCRCLRR